MADYYPDYAPKSTEHFERMLTVFRNCVDANVMQTWVVMYTLDMSYPREDILVAMGCVEREKGWKLS